MNPIKSYLSLIGRKGGKVKSATKTAACKRNGFQPGKGRKRNKRIS